MRRGPQYDQNNRERVSLNAQIAVEARNTVKAFGQGDATVRALNDVSATIRKGEFFTLLGPSGCGKTTLLRLIAGFEMPTSGQILLDGQDITWLPPNKRPVNTVFQSYALFPHLTVAQNVAFGLQMQGKPAAEVKETTARMLALVKLEAMAGRKTSQLSGGQQQRVALARSLVKDTEFLLLDEPLVHLDYKLREQLRDEFRRIFHASDNRLVVYATTEPLEAMIMQGLVVVMHEGRVVQVGDYREVYRRPANTTAATIFNDPPMNLFEGRIEAGQVRIGGDTALAVPEHFRALTPGQYVFGARASEVTLGGAVSAEVALAEINGSTTVFHLDLPFGSLVLEREGVDPHAIGDRVGITLPVARFFAFDARTGNLVAAPDGD
jgi:ABC-type Fe3+/spermidine/putrescine transport system ATPase subunit